MAAVDSKFQFSPAVDISNEIFHQDCVVDSALLVQKLLHATSDLVYIYDLETGQVIYNNRPLAALLGYNSQSAQVDDKTILQVLLHPDDVATVTVQTEAIKTAADTDVVEMMYRLQHASGLWRLFAEKQIVYKRQANGQPVQILKIARDVTEQHEASLQLKTDNALKIAELEQASEKLALEREKMQTVSRFIGITAHELRTPLTIINTSLYLLKKMTDPIRQAERLQIIENQVAQLSRLISQMHLLMRLDSLTQLAETKALSLNILLTKLEQELGGAVAKKELMLELTFADDVPMVCGDMDLIVIALRNVLENAIMYSDSGTIRAQTAGHQDKVEVMISDSGIGIDSQDIEHIFERFYKIEKDKKGNRTSAGLGLAITKRIMELHGGQISVESQVGQGSTFHLSWPL